jgi:hypothetical protein
MGRIAKESDISEDVLYSKFNNKEHLIVTCMKKEAASLRSSVEYIQEQSKSALEAVFFTCINQFYYNCSLYPSFFQDLSSFTEADNLWRNYQTEFRKTCTGYFMKGITEGDFLPDQNYELTPIVLTEQLSTINMQKTVHQKTKILATMHNVCTRKGKTHLIQLIEKKKTI